MQTISLPFRIDGSEAADLMHTWRRVYSAAVRRGYVLAGVPGQTEKTIRDTLKGQFGGKGIDAWLLHCATLEAIGLRRRVPDGRMVFGGRKQLERRRKGLVSNDEWKRARLRPLCSIGDANYAGNRHFRLEADGRCLTLKILGREARLMLPACAGKWGVLLPAVARLAAGKEMSVTFRLGARTVDITFDEMDLRRLDPGVTLRSAKDADLAAAGRKRRGRKRGEGYAPAVTRPMQDRPVHPEWRDRIPHASGRAVGIDLNPDWIGISVVQNTGPVESVASTRLLDYRLVKTDLPLDAPDELVREVLARACGEAISMARRWNAGLLGVEDGLGRLRSGGRNRTLNRRLNGWARSVFTSMLGRRCRLAGIEVVALWCAYSTTIGNMCFAAPDACAAAAEIARRALVLRGEGSEPAGSGKGLLPVFEPDVLPTLWKEEVGRASDWKEAHGVIKASQARAGPGARVGYRRPHYDHIGRDPQGRSWIELDGHAVERLGHKHRPGLLIKPASRRLGPTTFCK